jgi:predicted regulator of Ras-like GTPase activity (Roadblock/LC7/MglB family)
VQNAARNVELTWLMDDFVDRVVGIDRAVVLSSDGILIGRSSGLAADDGEHLSAVASAFQSLSRGAARRFEGGGVRQTMVEMDNSFLFVMAAGPGACLAALAVKTSDLGLVAYEMNRLVKRVGMLMTTQPRTAPAATSTISRASSAPPLPGRPAR